MGDKKQKQHCKDCTFYWTHSTSKNHCCKFGKRADKAHGQCINTGAKSTKSQGGAE